MTTTRSVFADWSPHGGELRGPLTWFGAAVGSVLPPGEDLSAEWFAWVLDQLVSEGDCILIVERTGGTGGYVQFLVDDAERLLYAETVSNEYLLSARALTPAEEMALLDLGWLPPSRSRDIDVPGSPNFNRLFEYPVPVGELAVLALKTLRLLHGDVRPGGLDVTFFRRKQKAPYGARGAREP